MPRRELSLDLSTQNISSTGAPWLFSRNAETVYRHVGPPNARSCVYPSSWRMAVNASSSHPGGVNLLLADGSVRFLKDTVNVSGIAAELHKRYSDRVRFVGIYVREAHPADGWSTRRNAKSGIEITQPVTFEERRAVAERCRTTLALPMPLLVDELDDRAGNGYSAMPDRLYLLDADGRVVFKGGRGPFGFQPGELEQILVLHLIERGRASNATE
jgi:prepilin-type processing-associated H-X9-DG protein